MKVVPQIKLEKLRKNGFPPVPLSARRSQRSIFIRMDKNVHMRDLFRFDDPSRKIPQKFLLGKLTRKPFLYFHQSG